MFTDVARNVTESSNSENWTFSSSGKGNWKWTNQGQTLTLRIDRVKDAGDQRRPRGIVEGCTLNSTNRVRVSSRKLLTDYRLAGTELPEILMGLMKEGPPDEGASRESRHRADSEKSAKLVLGRRCPLEGDVSSIVRTRWGLRPLNIRFSSLTVTCTFNGKYR